MGIVERSEELLTLEELLTSDHLDTGKIVLIEGATTGKTSLLHAFASRAVESGATFLSASASRAERDLPLGVVSQLFRGPALSAEDAERAERLLGDGALTAMAYRVGNEVEAGVQVPAPILNRLSAILLEMAECGPLVIGVDDIHHADVPSLQFLLYLARRTRFAHVLLVLTECPQPSRPHSPLHADLMRQPSSRRLRLNPLSERGVAAVLAEHFDASTARRLTSECHLVSGGNPLLLQALIEDLRSAAPAQPGSLVFGDAFRQAVLTCFYRSESAALARGIAVLPEDASAVLLGELVQLDAESVRLTRDMLGAAGLLDVGGFRHETIRTAVLSGMRPDERTALHVRAAELLYGHGASTVAVADRLLAADQAPALWAVTVLQDAAGQALAEGGVSHAIDRLRLALRDCADEEQRPAVHLDLVRAEWLVGPETSARHLPELSRALRKRRLSAADAATVIACMLWLGRTDMAHDAVIESRRRPGVPPPWWLRYAYPGLARQKPFDDGSRSPGRPNPLPTAPYLKVDAMMTSALAQGAHDETVAQAVHILTESSSAFRTLAPIAAMATLIYVDELDKAEWWCESFDRSEFPRPPTMAALLAGLRALIHVRRGELGLSIISAREAFNLMTPKGWGVAVGVPLAVMLLALTAAGEYEEAEKYLDTPVPDALFQSPLALPYLQARGRYYLAINRPKAALAEFGACGELMTSWSFDVPTFVSWRSDMAEALLALDDREEARRLLADQLISLPRGCCRTRGITLRLLAAASDVERRMEPLTEAVELLERSGDRLELARALAGLSEYYRVAGQTRRAEAMARRARSLAAECGAEDVEIVKPPQPAEPCDELDPDLLTGLSDAERRVAALAADGYTNRQIARRLYVTMSTVEQHLTRVYRKLKISRRTDLPLHLSLLPSQAGHNEPHFSRMP